MPFAPFVGVNHHDQSILLGCGFLSFEDTDAFVWLFKSWLCCMSYRPPVGIVTDQCRAMKIAVEVVFPNARHRWCLWHIMKKIPRKLQGYHQYKEMKRGMKTVVYESTSVDDFLSSWANLINMFDLSTNNWLSTLFEERHLEKLELQRDKFGEREKRGESHMTKDMSSKHEKKVMTWLINLNLLIKGIIYS